MKNILSTHPYICGFLLFCVASSKHIIIYNEELLVAGSFLCFVLYIHKSFGKSITEQLDEKRNSMLTELQSLANIKKNGAENLKKTYVSVPYTYKSLQSLQKYIFAYIYQIGNAASLSFKFVAREKIQNRILHTQNVSLYFSAMGENLYDSLVTNIYVQTQKFYSFKRKYINSKNLYHKSAKKGIDLLQKYTK